MTLPQRLHVEEGTTSARLSWRTWLLLPLVLFSLMGVVMPFVAPDGAADLVRDAAPRITDEDLYTEAYHGELELLIRRPEIPARDRAVIEGLHLKLEADAERHGGLIRRRDRALVDNFLRTYKR